MPTSHPIKRILRRFGFNLTRIPKIKDPTLAEEILVDATYAPWQRDVEFLKIFQAIRQETFLDKYRCWVLWLLIEQVSKFEGVLIEIGVWRGGSAALIATRARQCGIPQTVYLCDTFRGIVKSLPDEQDYREGSLAMPRTAVDRFIKQFDLNNVRVLEGIFPEETGAQITEDKVRLCHIDVDVYQSARDIFEWVWGRIVIGGVVIFDDYGHPTTHGVIRFVQETRMRDDLIFVHSVSGQAIFVKIK